MTTKDIANDFKSVKITQDQDINIPLLGESGVGKSASRAPLKPHQVQNTTSINEARRLIVQLSQPLADISQLIYDNIRILEKHQFNLRMENQSLDALKERLYIPTIDLKVNKLPKPVTVCTSTKCVDVVKIGDIKKWHYKKRCHDPCYLPRVVIECVGDPRLQTCAAMDTTMDKEKRTCRECGCHFSAHMHVYYLTEIDVDGKIVDKVVQNNIKEKEIVLLEAQRLIEQAECRKKELEGERETIIKSAAHFAHFLQQNEISQFNDYYKGHIEDLINREKGHDSQCDLDLIGNLEALLRQYEEIKEEFDNSLKLKQTYQLGNVIPAVTAQSVKETIHKLYNLKLHGNKIREFIKKQETSRNSEYGKTCDDVYLKSTGVYTKEKKDKSKMNKKKDAKSTDDETKQDWIMTDDGKKKNNFKNQYHDSSHQGQFHGPPLHHQYTPQNLHHDHLQGPPGGHYQQAENQNSSLDHHESQDRKSGKEKRSTSSSNASESNLFIFLNYIFTIEFLILLEAFLCWYLFYNGYVLFLMLLVAILCWHLYNLFVSKTFEFIPSIFLNFTYAIGFLILLAAILCWQLCNGYVFFLILLAAILCWYLYNCFVSKAFEFNHFIFFNYICTIEFLILLEAILCWYLYNGYVLFLILLAAMLCWYLYL